MFKPLPNSVTNAIIRGGDEGRATLAAFVRSLRASSDRAGAREAIGRAAWIGWPTKGPAPICPGCPLC